MLLEVLVECGTTERLACCIRVVQDGPRCFADLHTRTEATGSTVPHTLHDGDLLPSSLYECQVHTSTLPGICLLSHADVKESVKLSTVHLLCPYVVRCGAQHIYHDYNLNLCASPS